MKKQQSIVLGVLLNLASMAAGADCKCAVHPLTNDKSSYSLFNPTHDQGLRMKHARETL